MTAGLQVPNLVVLCGAALNTFACLGSYEPASGHSPHTPSPAGTVLRSLMWQHLGACAVQRLYRVLRNCSLQAGVPLKVLQDTKQYTKQHTKQALVNTVHQHVAAGLLLTCEPSPNRPGQEPQQAWDHACTPVVQSASTGQAQRLGMSSGGDAVQAAACGPSGASHPAKDCACHCMQAVHAAVAPPADAPLQQCNAKEEPVAASPAECRQCIELPLGVGTSLQLLLAHSPINMQSAAAAGTAAAAGMPDSPATGSADAGRVGMTSLYGIHRAAYLGHSNALQLHDEALRAALRLLICSTASLVDCSLQGA